MRVRENERQDKPVGRARCLTTNALVSCAEPTAEIDAANEFAMDPGLRIGPQSLQPKTAFWRFPPVRAADLEAKGRFRTATYRRPSPTLYLGSSATFCRSSHAASGR
jgi:hypothetical protein